MAAEVTRTFVCLGDVMTDVVARLEGHLVRGSDSPAPILLAAGGSAANTSAWLAATGSPSALIGRVGADLAGDAALDALESCGVAAYVCRDPTRATGTCIVLVSPDGERTMIPDAGANSGLTPDDVPTVLFQPTAHLHLSGYALLNEGSRAAALHALGLARATGTTISIDPASAGPLESLGADVFLAWCQGADALLANEDEARVLTGTDDPARAALALTAKFAEVVVKIGAQGALWAGRGVAEVTHLPADAVVVVDTTGAGDAFAAGWLPAALAGVDPVTALRAGCALAARAVAQVGARPT